MSTFLRSTAFLAAAGLPVLVLAGCGGTPSLPASTGSQSLAARQNQSDRSDRSAPPVTNPYPFAQGDVFNFNYADSLVTTTGGTPTKSYVDGTDTLTINGSESFDGGTWTELTEVFAYTDYNSAKQSTATGTLTTDFYRNFVQNGDVLDYLQAGYTTSNQESDANGTTIQGTTDYTYGTPYEIDAVPETKSSWKEPLQNTETGQTITTPKSGSTETLTYSFTRNADLSYTRNAQFVYSPGGTYTETDTVAANGSAEDSNDFPSNNPTNGTTTWAAPAKVGGSYVITVVYTPTSGSKTTTNVPDWYPGGGKVKSLASDVKKDSGTVKVPKTCGTAVAGQTAVELVETQAYLDPEQGTYDTDTETTYVVSGEGRVCVISKLVDDTYDNRVTGDLTTSVTHDEVLSLTSESLQNMRKHNLIVGFAQGRPR